MNHLNFFTYYQNMNPKHENNLTRAFLICLENIPETQKEFFRLLASSHKSDIFDSTIGLDSILEEVYTQISNENKKLNHEGIRNRKLISILISDERLIESSEINNNERQAIYDSVLLCKPNLLFIVENKPNILNLWEKQLSPNVRKSLDVEIDKIPCSVSWSEIINIFNNLLDKNELTNLEKRLLSDFINYIDYYWPELNPYTYLKSCKGNEILINKRCRNLLSSISINGVFKLTEYHRGWGNFIRSGKSTVTQIKIDYIEKLGRKYIKLDMVTGDTQISSKETYKSLDVEKLKQLMSNPTIKVSNNFHYQFMNENLIYFEGKVDVIDYVNFWRSNQHLLSQIKREQNEKRYSFEEFNNIMIDAGIIKVSELENFEKEVISRKYSRLNVCASFVIYKYWTLEEAIELDSRNAFAASISQAIEEIYNIFGQSIM